MSRLLPALLLVLAAGCGRCGQHEFVTEFRDWWESMTPEERAAVTVPYSPTDELRGDPIRLLRNDMDPRYDTIVEWWNDLTNAQREAWIREHVANMWDYQAQTRGHENQYRLAAEGLRTSNGTLRPLRVVANARSEQ